MNQPIPTHELDHLADHALITGVKEHVLGVFASGSLFEGFGNAKSDIDLYVILDDEKNRPGNQEEYKTWANQREVEITFVGVSAFEEIIAKASDPKGYAFEAALLPYQILLGHRLVTGVAVANREFVEPLQARLPKAVLAKYISDSFLARAKDVFNDFSGSLPEADDLTTAFLARWLVEMSFDALLAFRGTTSMLAKWRIKRARAVLSIDDPFFAEFVRLSSHIGLDNEHAMLNYFERAARFYQDVCSFIAATQLSTKMVRPRFCQASVPTRGPTRPSNVQLHHKNGRTYAFVDGGAKYELDKYSADVWLSTYDEEMPIVFEAKIGELVKLGLLQRI